MSRKIIFDKNELYQNNMMKINNKDFNMENYIDAIESYKNKACEIINSNCEKCEARQEYNGNYYCCFDTTIRFIKYANSNLIK